MKGIDPKLLLSLPGVTVGPTVGERMAGLNASAYVRTPDEAFGSESEFDAAMNAFAKRHGWRTYHTHNSRKSEEGFPDRIMIRGPVLIAAELKYGKNTATAAQRNWLDDFAAVRIVHSRLWYPENWHEIITLLTEGT